MTLLKSIAYVIIAIYFIIIILLYLLQTRLIFYPGKLSKDFKFKLNYNGEEIFITTADGERINALFFKSTRDDVILYFHGNAGDLSGWQFVAEDFTDLGYNILIIDYRGYGKSSGSISEKGFYEDANAAYRFLKETKKFTDSNIIIYGRSIGSGIAVDLATKQKNKGLVLESPYASLGQLAGEKLPFFFPGLYLNYKFNNLEKINHVQSPVVFLHGGRDELIPSSHTEKLFAKFTGRKRKIIISRGGHNDLIDYPEYHDFLSSELNGFLNSEKP